MGRRRERVRRARTTWRRGPPALVLTLLALGTGSPAEAQNLLAIGVGGAAGLAAGGYTSVAIVVAKARAGRYLYSADDALGWETAPIVLGTTTGALIGSYDPERLRNAILGGAAAGLLGMGVGTLIGREIWDPPEGRWAGGVIGGAVGLLAGSLVGVLLPTGDDGPGNGEDAPARIVVSLPLRP